MAVADVWEALTADRPYRAGMSVDEALAVITGMAGDHLAAEVVAVLVDIVPDLPAVPASQPLVLVPG